MSKTDVTAGRAPTPSRGMKRAVALACSVIAAAALQGCGTVWDTVGSPSGPAAADLEALRVVDERPSVDGYDRSCAKGHGCVFGPRWSDDVDVDGGHNGCDTRNDILRRDLSKVRLKPGSHGCIVLAGTLQDPYTGQAVQFDRTRAAAVQIDHVVPLAAAWDLGAARWTPRRRQEFANDPRNLLATSGAVNNAKGDSTPGQWLPETNRCSYATKYVTVIADYDLAITTDDRSALRSALRHCTTGGPSSTSN